MAERRTRKKPGELNPALILTAAREIAQQDGLDKLSIRRLAARLDCGVMSIYRHYPDKQALLLAVIDDFVSRAQVVEHVEPDLNPWLIVCFQRIHQALSNNPDYIPLLGDSLLMGRSSLQVVDTIVGRVAAQGHSQQTALLTFSMMLNYTIGAVVTEATVKRHSETFDIEAIKQFPNLASGLEPLILTLSGQRFEHGLEQILTTLN